MTPDVVVDIGNTRMKWGRCVPGHVEEMMSLPLDNHDAWADQYVAWELYKGCKWAAASVNPLVSSRFQEWANANGDEVLFIDHSRRLPLNFGIEHPDQIGIDRLMNACAAYQLVHPNPAVVISVGTATTVDLIDEEGTFQGGAIFPGPRLMASALHAHTAKLPLVDAQVLPTVVAPGRNTKDAILTGIRAAIVGATVHLIAQYARLAPLPWVLITGGAAGDLGEYDFGSQVRRTTTFPTLTLEGIRIAAEALP